MMGSRPKAPKESRDEVVRALKDKLRRRYGITVAVTEMGSEACYREGAINILLDHFTTIDLIGIRDQML